MTESSLKKKSNENENQYLWRIGGMIEDGYIKNWESVLSVVNEELFGSDSSHYKGESAYRKKYNAARDFYKDVFIKLGDDKATKDLERKIHELQTERFKVSAEKNELTRFNRQRSRILRAKEGPKLIIARFWKLDFKIGVRIFGARRRAKRDIFVGVWQSPERHVPAGKPFGSKSKRLTRIRLLRSSLKTGKLKKYGKNR